jgi:hypothetical protein
VKIDEEWPPLPKLDIALNALTDQITQPPTMEGTNDNTPMDSDSQATPSETQNTIKRLHERIEGLATRPRSRNMHK